MYEHSSVHQLQKRSWSPSAEAENDAVDVAMDQIKHLWQVAGKPKALG
jgi:hypothetical protein